MPLNPAGGMCPFVEIINYEDIVKPTQRIFPPLCLLILMASVTLSSCAGADRETEIAVIVALTQTAAAQQLPPVDVAATEAPAQTEVPAPTDTSSIATEEPAPAPVPLSGYQPYDSTSAAQLSASISSSTGLVSVISSAPFEDYVTGQKGTAVQITYSSTNAALPAGADPFGTAMATLISQGWVEDTRYGAGGATGIQTGIRKDATLCLIGYAREPIDRALCSAGESISMCFDKLAPEQILYKMTLTCSTYFP